MAMVLARSPAYRMMSDESIVPTDSLSPSVASLGRLRGRTSKSARTVASNLQYRLKEVDGGTLIAFKHTALGRGR
jgi:hypothetical protein